VVDSQADAAALVAQYSTLAVQASLATSADATGLLAEVIGEHVIGTAAGSAVSEALTEVVDAEGVTSAVDAEALAVLAATAMEADWRKGDVVTAATTAAQRASFDTTSLVGALSFLLASLLGTNTALVQSGQSMQVTSGQSIDVTDKTNNIIVSEHD
jgi:hypothetical protein